VSGDQLSLAEAQQEFLRMFELGCIGTDIEYSEYSRLRDLLSSLNWRDVFQLVDETGNLQDVTDSEAYWAVIDNLRRRTLPEVYEYLLSWAKSGSVSRKIAAANVLAQFGEQYDSVDNPMRETILSTLEPQLGDSDQAVIEACLYALGHINGGDLVKISEFKHHRSPEIRLAAVTALLRRDEFLARNALIFLSSDESAKVRDWATFGLGSMSEIDSPEIRNALVARLDDPDEDTRGEAIVGLSVRKDERVIAAILSALEERSCRSLVFEACEVFPHATFLPRLREFFEANPDDKDIADAVSACTTGIPRD
jgi:HEAT repeat protein